MNDFDFSSERYEKWPSKLASVTLYRKKSDDELNRIPTREVEEFHCPKCDAPVRYMPANGLSCEHCGYSEQPEQIPFTDEGNELTPEYFRAMPKGWGLPRSTLVCRRCQAKSAVPVSDVVYTCPFCLSNRVVETHEENEMIRPSQIIPFKIEEKQVQAFANQWFKALTHKSPDLNSIRLENIHAVYVPVWLLTADTTANWQGTAVKVKENAVQRVIQKGYDSIALQNGACSANQKIQELPVDDLIHGLSDHLQLFQPEFVAGIPTLLPDVSLTEGWREIRETLQGKYINDIIPTQRKKFTNVNEISVSYRNERWSLGLIPVYLATYEHQGKTYHVTVNGYDGEGIGDYPISIDYLTNNAVSDFIPAILMAFGLLFNLLVPLNFQLIGGSIGCFIASILIVFLNLDRWLKHPHLDSELLTAVLAVYFFIQLFVLSDIGWVLTVLANVGLILFYAFFGYQLGAAAFIANRIKSKEKRGD